MNFKKKFFSIAVFLFLSLAVVSSFVQKPIKSTKIDSSKEKNLVQVAIIGGGVAGLAAAQITAKRNLHTVVFEGGDPGGQMNFSKMYHWLGVYEAKGSDAVVVVKNEAIKRGAFFSSEKVEKADFSTYPFQLILSNGDTVSALSVLVATGARPGKLKAPGVDAFLHKGIVTEKIDKDSSWEGKVVAVVGSGDDAVRKTEIVAPSAKKVFLLVRGKELKVDPSDRERLKKFPNVKILYETSVKAVFGGEKHLKGVDVETPKGSSKLECDVLAVAIGIEPNSELFEKLLILDENGFIRLKGRGQETSVEGVFAAGDVTQDCYHKSLLAATDGMKAGIELIKFLKEKKLEKLSSTQKMNLYLAEVDNN